CDLHSQTDTKEWQSRLASGANRFHHPVDAADAEPAWHEQAVVAAENGARGLPIKKSVAVDPGDVDADVVGDAAVNERFVDTLVAVDELRVLADDRDPHAHV